MNSIPICRVCLQTSLEYIDFETSFVRDDADNENEDHGDSKPFTYLDCFRMCTRLEIADFDCNNLSVPQSLCGTCGIELKITYDFLNKAKKAHEILHEKTETKVEIVEDERTEYEVLQPTQIADCKNEDLVEKEDRMKSKRGRLLHTYPQVEEEFELVNVDSFYPLSLNKTSGIRVNIRLPRSVFQMVEDTVDVDVKDESRRCGGPTKRASKDVSNKKTPPNQRRHKSPPKKASERNANKNVKLVPQVTTNQFQCDMCSKVFANKDRLRRHITRERKSKIWLCHACPRTYRTYRAYNEHALRHEGKFERNFTCELCERKFFRRSTLIDHVKTHETNREPTFQCDKCDKSFFHRGSLTLHKQSHADQWIQCEICEKRYLRQSDLIIHLRSHSGDLPYKCHKCDRAFAQVGHLNKHLRHHDGYRYKCDVCDKEYLHQSTLIEHYKGHTGLPLKCSICDKGFVKMSKIHRHLEVVHKVENAEEIDQFIIKIKTKKVYLWQKGITA